MTNVEKNRIVCHSSTIPNVYFIGCFNKTEDSKFELSTENDSGIPEPHMIRSEDLPEGELTLESLTAHVDRLYPFEKQGVIVYMPNNIQFKIMNSKYVDLFNTRGNETSINFRYLQVRHDPDMVKRLELLYPTHIPIFKKI